MNFIHRVADNILLRMASRRAAISSVTKTATPVSAQLTAQAVKMPPPPLSPSSPPAISLKDLQDTFAETVRKTEEMFNKTEEMFNKVDSKLDQKTDLLMKKQEELFKLQEDFRESLSSVLGGLAEHIDSVAARMEEVEQKVDLSDHRLGNIEEDLEVVKNEVLIGQLHEMDFAIRIRGLAEDPNENLKDQLAAAIADEIGCEKETIFDDMERVYRVNSWVAQQRNLPRDIVVYFTRKARRNEIIQRFYQRRFKILQQEVILLKEIPSKILKGRKDYAFLVQELKSRQLLFRWDVPVGIIITYAGKRYRLNTIKKAKDFLASVLRGESIPQEAGEQRKVSLTETLHSDGESPQRPGSVKQQRMTRAAYKRKEKEQKADDLASVASAASPLGSEPVGGARPKVSAQSLVAVLRSSKPRNG